MENIKKFKAFFDEDETKNDTCNCGNKCTCGDDCQCGDDCDCKECKGKTIH